MSSSAQFVPVDELAPRVLPGVKTEKPEALNISSYITDSQKGYISDLGTTYFSDLPKVAGVVLAEHCIDEDGLRNAVGRGEGISKCYSIVPDPKYIGTEEIPKVLLCHPAWKEAGGLLGATKEKCDELSRMTTIRYKTANG
jgi:hypothetical protein